jgi:ATP-dependent exoDNAse (exonuclease V) beta subunit
MVSDSAQRELALDPRRSFIVQAPAGSGKTDLLVKRYLRLLAAVEKPEEILAITFTIKAAAEMRKRVLEKLPNGAEIAHRLRIQTIDALCVSLTRQMPVRSRLGAQPAIVEDAAGHYSEAAKRTLQDLSPQLERLLLHLDNNLDAAESLIAAMLARRDQWLRKAGNPPSRSDLESNFRLEREKLLRQAQSLDRRASEAFARDVLTQDGNWRKRSAAARALTDNEPLRLALCALLAMPPERYTDEQWQVLESILALLPMAVAQLKVVFAERGEADFTEFMQAALRALGSADAPTDLLLALDYRIRHILVDEFQDTSYSQWALLEGLTAGWEPGDGRTLFLVGDPMQSIYRFREAEVALFLRARSQGLGNAALQPITLSTNFRSQAKLVEWFNASFSTIFPAVPDASSGSVPYSPAVPHDKALGGPAATWHALPDREAEAKRVVQLVQESKERTAILVRRRDALADIVPALKAARIKYRAIEIEHLGEKQVVQDLYALTRALSHLGDRIAWLSILRAPWAGLSLNQLFDIAGSDRYATIWELIQQNEQLQSFREIMGPAIANRCRGTLRERVEGVWLALGGPACVESETDLEDAEIYLDELERLERAGDLEDMAGLGDALQQLYALPDLDAGEEDLQIMTIHKAKGLEFRTVIVPGLDRGPGRSDPPLFLWMERSAGGMLLAPIKETGGDDDPAYRYLKHLDAEAEDTEASRLLYVAATRAAQRLHLLACVRCDEHGEIRPPYAHSLLERAWPAAAPHYARMVPEQLAMDFMREPRPPITGLRRLALDVSRVNPPAAVRWKAAAEGREEEQIEFSWAGESARHVGTVVHRWLQRIAEDQLADWNEQRVDELRPRFARDLERRGVAAAEAKRCAELVVSALSNALADERGRWILGPHPVMHSEHRLRARTPHGVRTYVIDRMFVTADRVRWVVDFKTSRHEGADPQAFLDRERGRYTGQLKNYSASLDNARAGLYFPLMRGWREIS